MSDTERAWDLKKASAVAAWTRGRPQGPVSMEISPTMACNENCMFCRRKDEMKGYYAATTDVDDDKWISIVSDALEMGTQKILFRGGGEPLLRKSLFMRLFPLRVRYPEAELLVLTNGTTIDDRLAEGFVRSGWNDLTISLQGGTAAVHDAITDLPGSFERVTRSLELINAWKDRLGLDRPSLNFHVVLTRKSCREIGPLIEFARKHRVVQIGLFPMHNAPYPQHVHDLEMRPEDEKDYRELVPGYIAAMERCGIRHCVQMSYQGENVELSRPAAAGEPAAAVSAPGPARRGLSRGLARRRHGRSARGDERGTIDAVLPALPQLVPARQRARSRDFSSGGSMKIALVQMPPNPRDTPPYDVALACANLRRDGHEVVVLDSNNDIYHQVYKQRPYWKFRMSSHADEPAAALFEQRPELFHGEVKRILDVRPDVVVFRTENGLVNAMAAARLLRDRAPKMPILSSGALTADKHALHAWKTSECFADDGNYTFPFDYHIVGEDDLVLSPVLEALATGDRTTLSRRFEVKGKVIDAINSPMLVVDNLDDTPFYDFTDFDFMRYADPKMLRINVSRSCVKHCAFCIDWIITRKFRCMSGDRWFEEYQCQLKRHPHLFHIRHYDRLLNGNIPSLARFTDRMLAAYDKPVIIWGGDCVITPEMTSDLLQKMSRAGCINLGVGFESGSARVRKSMDKDFFTNEMARRFFADCKRFGITATMNILLGFPTETEQDFQESLDFIELNKENLFEVRITFPTLHVAPGSVLSAAPQRFDLADTHDDKWVSRDGVNDYVERIKRFERLCRRMVELNVTLAVNRRIVKTQAAVTNLVKELLPDTPARQVRPPVETERERGMRELRELTSSSLPAAEKIAAGEALLERFGAEPSVLSRVHFFLGTACMGLGRQKEGRDHFSVILDRHAEDTETAVEVGLQLADLDSHSGRWEDVRRRCEALLPTVKGNPRNESGVLTLLSQAHFEAGDFAGSLTRLESLMERYPDSFNPGFYRARLLRLRVLQSLGRAVEAIEAAGKLLLEYPDAPEKQADIRFHLALLCKEAGESERALKLFREVAENVAACPEYLTSAKMHIGEVEKILREASSAVETAKSGGVR